MMSPSSTSSSTSISQEQLLCTHIELSGYVDAALSGQTYDIAKLVHALFQNTFRVARLKTKLWYVFDGLKWRASEIGPYHELSKTVAPIFEKRLQFEIQTSGMDHDSTIINRLETIIYKLKNVNTKELICKECLYMFYDPDFIYKLDVNYSLVCFANGVLDIKHNDFRAGTHTDNISLSIDMDFIHPKTTQEQSELQRVLDMFNKYRRTVVDRRREKYIFVV